ncbi:MAG: MFS transporter [Oscillospiraceae bacterium]|nr:MFS transporter [Oscillospiraceae bacterium]
MPSDASYKRRYVGGWESMSYVLFSSSKTFHINEFQTRYVIDVLKINLRWNAVISFINGIWDVINDGLLGLAIDKTHTRWGKFRPYLLLYATVGTVFTTLYWLTPLLFDKNPQNLAKAAFWLVLAMTLEAFTTVRDISETGLVSTMTPNPDDKVRMYTMAEVIAPIWQDLPGVLMGLLIDGVNKQIVKFSMDSIYITMGIFTMVTCGLLALAFSIYARERVTQATERYSYREGLRAILRNKPLLILLLNDFLGGFSAEVWEQNYYIDVLGSATLRNIIRIPGAPFSYISYAYINKARAFFGEIPVDCRHPPEGYARAGCVRAGLHRRVVQTGDTYVDTPGVEKHRLHGHALPDKDHPPGDHPGRRGVRRMEHGLPLRGHDPRHKIHDRQDRAQRDQLHDHLHHGSDGLLHQRGLRPAVRAREVRPVRHGLRHPGRQRLPLAGPEAVLRPHWRKARAHVPGARRDAQGQAGAV